MHKLIVTTCCLLLATSAFADICPSVKDLKSSKHAQWQAFDSDDGLQLSPAREAKLTHEISHFVMAEWSKEKNKNMVHCYYTNDHGSAVEAYFAKENISPVVSSKYWYEVTGLMQCAAGADKCQFQVSPEMKNQLASNEES